MGRLISSLRLAGVPWADIVAIECGCRVVSLKV
jgi:hypothetical protein